MVASKANNSNPARIPALGLRTLALLFLSIALMYLDNRDNHLDAVRDAVGVAVYPLRLAVDAPARAASARAPMPSCARTACRSG